MKTRKPAEVPGSLKTINVKAVLRKRGIYLEQRVNKELKEAALPLARQMLKGKKKQAPKPPRHFQFSDELVNAYWQKQIHIVDVVEKKFEAKLQQYISKMVDGFLVNLDSEVSKRKFQIKDFKAKDYFDDNEDDLMATAQLDFTPLLDNVAILAGQQAMDLTKTGNVYTLDQMRTRIAANVTKFTASLLDTDRQKLIDIIAQGIEDGKSVPQIRGAIQADFDAIEKNQAQLITRTEVLRASVQASKDAYEQSGVVEGLQWLTAGAVDECADYEGEVRSLSGDGFYDVESDFQDGDPPLHPNCRCVLLPVLIDEKAYIPKENKALRQRIVELESMVDKRTKAFKEIKAKSLDDQAYIKALENYSGQAEIIED